MSTGTAIDVVMPQMGVSVSEGTISRWVKQVGDPIEADETIVEISTDKVDTEVPSPGSGTVTDILVPEGETVPVGTRIAVINGDGSAAAAAPAEAAPEEPAAAPAPEAPEPSSDRPHFADQAIAEAPAAPTAAAPAEAPPQPEQTNGEARTFMSPVVARMVAEHDLDVAQIPGTGRGGRVTKKDVERYLTGGQASAPTPAPAPAAAPAPAPAAARAPQPAAAPAAAAGTQTPDGVEEASPLSNLRKVIARNMRHSVDTAAHVTSVSEVDMTHVVEIRKELNKRYVADYGVKLSFMPFIMRAVIDAIPRWPWVNAEIRGDEVVVKRFVNLGVAVAIDDAKGLVVPVIRHAEEKNLLGLARALIDVADRARAKKLTPDELSGGTFTITNPGVFGAIIGTPIIPMPQVAIIDVEAIVKRPVVVTDTYGNDSIAIRSMMYLPISYDHRLVDGAYAAQFMQVVKSNLETWGADDY
jgi:2-oxoglutarate dehydrogenase E2 component (dihydrolipoamide succinyltransferase)